MFLDTSGTFDFGGSGLGSAAAATQRIVVSRQAIRANLAAGSLVEPVLTLTDAAGRTTRGWQLRLFGAAVVAVDCSGPSAVAHIETADAVAWLDADEEMPVVRGVARAHLNQHQIRRNLRDRTNKPCVTVKQGSVNRYAHAIRIDGPSVLVYRATRPLSCGARAWLETVAPVVAVGCEFTTF